MSSHKGCLVYLHNSRIYTFPYNSLFVFESVPNKVVYLLFHIFYVAIGYLLRREILESYKVKLYRLLSSRVENFYIENYKEIAIKHVDIKPLPVNFY